MNNILDMLFLKDVKLDRLCFRNLYYSSNKSSFAGFDYDIICENKLYDKYEILKEYMSNIGEYHKEFKAFIKLDNNIYFIRILEDNDNKIYDILIYTANKKEEYDKYDRIFFPKIITIPKSYENINKPIIYVDNHINIVKNEELFSSYLGYEDWDYKNKCLNMIDVSCLDNIMVDFNGKSFTKSYNFKKNGGDIIRLNISFIYLDDFYYIKQIDEE